MAKDVDEVALSEWLSEHGPYEICMQRYCRNKMHEAKEQLDYNAHFDAFATHARVLIDFFTGRRKGDLFATTFVSAYRAPKREHLQTAINRIDAQVAHPTLDRVIQSADKISRDDCDKIALWIESALESFLKALPTERRQLWDDGKARNDLVTTYYVASGQLSASSADPVIVSVTVGASPTVTLKTNGS